MLPRRETHRHERRHVKLWQVSAEGSGFGGPTGGELLLLSIWLCVCVCVDASVCVFTTWAWAAAGFIPAEPTHSPTHLTQGGVAQSRTGQCRVEKGSTNLWDSGGGGGDLLPLCRRHARHITSRDILVCTQNLWHGPKSLDFVCVNVKISV